MSLFGATNKQQEFIKWVRVMLEDQDINGKDNFLDVGGNSLLATELIAKYEAKYKRKIPMLELLQRSMADAVNSAQLVVKGE